MAKRISRREFQEGLAERLQQAARGETSQALLAVLAGSEHWLLNLSDAGEILPLPPLAPVPLTKQWFAGLANVRGSLYAAVDFSAFQGAGVTARNADGRLLLIGSRYGLNAALLVSRALGLKSLETLELQQPATADRRPWAGEAYIDNKGQTWRMLCVRELLADAEFLDIAA